MRSTIVHLRMQPCMVCGETAELDVPRKAYENWLNGQNISFAFPDMSIADRELLITGTHDDCFNTLFAGDEEIDEEDGDE